MKPREQGGVVDSRLNVYGVQGLKVAGKHSLQMFVQHLLVYLRAIVDVSYLLDSSKQDIGSSLVFPQAFYRTGKRFGEHL